ncbi:hypothetical protein, partial [Vibrio alginolyticus]|uniref:hypothetical protein n=1 Tax=Vibrio alginolyticus TaxID=663 RepID=UPI00215BDFC8
LLTAHTLFSLEKILDFFENNSFGGVIVTKRIKKQKLSFFAKASFRIVDTGRFCVKFGQGRSSAKQGQC